MKFSPHHDNSFIAHARIHELKINSEEGFFKEYLEIIATYSTSLGFYFTVLKQNKNVFYEAQCAIRVF